MSIFVNYIEFVKFKFFEVVRSESGGEGGSGSRFGFVRFDVFSSFVF